MNIYYYRAPNGWVTIWDDKDNTWRYLYFTKREAVRMFKERFGYRYKRGVNLIVVEMV